MEGMKWIKLSTNIFDDEKILLIENLPEHDAILVIWFKLLCLAGKHCTDGIFLMNDRIPYTDEMLAAIFRRPLNTIRLALATFEQYGMIEIVNDTITMPNWEKHQNIEAMSRKKAIDRERQRRFRDKQREQLMGGELMIGQGLPRNDDGELFLGETQPNPAGCEETMKARYEEIVETRAANCEGTMETGSVSPAQRGVTRDIRVSHAPVTHPDVDGDGEEEHLSASTAGRTAPTIEEVENYFRSHGLSVDARRFFEINERRGWVTKTGKPVDDWKKLAETWNLHEKPARASLPSGGSASAARVPTPEEVMRRYGCSREKALQMLEEDLY
ncbi:hypothetical protein BHK98_09240 [Hornefia porci]|uniref:Phage replisome organiser N-terminal domain-containing protein n=2 Tax=Hornefia porci TaxID=2652292 RepID=A0A1Q9JJ34_9FIRM|nr:hypothetical protein BHK98_09240 [Hornefia porci]